MMRSGNGTGSGCTHRLLGWPDGVLLVYLLAGDLVSHVRRRRL